MRVISYRYFGERVVRTEPDDQKAFDQAVTMTGLVEYTDVHLYDLVPVDLT